MPFGLKKFGISLAALSRQVLGCTNLRIGVPQEIHAKWVHFLRINGAITLFLTLFPSLRGTLLQVAWCRVDRVSIEWRAEHSPVASLKLSAVSLSLSRSLTRTGREPHERTSPARSRSATGVASHARAVTSPTCQRTSRSRDVALQPGVPRDVHHTCIYVHMQAQIGHQASTQQRC